ncbi:Uncharacterized protein TPAR_06842 [Tolypocladium paradoxum]|uniref:Uncharacterized protein n=1 Tax=Tolypocladium paradoxum TaxID=94208 RepID=A0A2S4KRU4_9HYPO|nr:Uncharacterized protein TPAR_06842 [Tolypocladium paradoxum]
MAAAESAHLAASHDDDSTTLEISPPATTSPSSPPTRSVTDRAATPLNLFSSSAAASRGGSGKAPASGSLAREDPFATVSPAETPEPSVSPGPAYADAVVDSVENVDGDGRPQRRDPGVATTRISGATVQGPNKLRARAHQYEPPAEVNARSPIAQMTNTTLPPDNDGEPDSPLSDARPLRTASVRADTKIAHPKPIARHAPINQPVSDLKLRPASSLSNIAHLEATAERLSMTSSIDDAIRDLHGELKRSDSRRSSILAANVRAHSTDICNNSNSSYGEAAAAVGQLKRHLSTSSSIVSTNIAARHGGYSPAAFVMSPNPSLTTGRLRSGSKNSAGRPDLDLDSVLSRHGPGKSSVRSVPSTKMSLAEISESEPVALNQAAFDEADAAPPIEEQIDESTLKLPQQDDEDVPSTVAFHQMLDDGSGDVHPQHRTVEELDLNHAQHENDEERPTSSHSNNTFQQCQDAFVDFDGVHWEPEDEEDLFVPPELETGMPTPRAAPACMMRPQSYMDLETGQHMLYYPAKVPAMLNLPPKLSSRPKAAQRNQRRSQILSAMMDSTGQPVSPEAKRNSAFSDLNRPSGAPDFLEQSWLPDPVAGQRDSFAALSSYGPLHDSEAKPDHAAEEPAAAPEAEPVVASDGLRRPQRLSAMDPEKRKSKSSLLNNLPPQLRASAFFDLPSVTADVEIKDGSAMATLDSILDASANAPVSAFTDHAFAGKLGSEIYGKAKKHKAQKSTATLNVLSPEPKERSSLMWLRKRSSSYNSEEQKRPHSMTGAPAQDTGDGSGEREGRSSPSGNSEDNVIRIGVDEPEPAEEDSESDDGYHGPPTTLLAELQLRKQEQQERTKNRFPNGMHATLLEMDTVAEQQRKHRKNKRVNLAWEDPGAHVDQNGSDDEDVPLAILVAMQQGAKNLADLERPMGLMQRRDLEDNEPLSHRRARLQGLEPPPPVILQNRQSVMSFPALRAVDNRSPHSVMGPTPSPRPEEIEVEGETLGERRRRLAAKDGSDSDLPLARPVSSAFSAELLSQFGDLDDRKEKAAIRKENKTPDVKVEEETLGQRRRRLQAEREAREREMSYGNLVGEPMQQRISRRLSMADVLAAHPKKESDARAQEARLRAEEEQRATGEREAKMAAMRKHMPQSLAVPNIERAGGFRGGVYNDGTGGYGPQAARSSPAVNTQGVAQAHRGNQNRSSVMLNNNYGGSVQQPLYGAMSTFGGMNSMGAYGGMNNMGLYNGGSTMGMYGAGMMSPGMQMQMPMQMPMPMGTGSVDRVEQWRRGVRP